MFGGKVKRTGPQVSTMSAGADLVLDAALRNSGQDRFDHDAIARVVADLALHATPPVNIALFGPWGSGKSSFFGLLHEKLTGSGRPVKIVRYDAWKYGGRALKKHFVGSIADQLELGGEDFKRNLAHDQEVVRFDLAAWVRKNRRSLIVGALLAILIALFWFMLVSLFVWAVDPGSDFSGAIRLTVTSVGTVLSLSFAALLFGPKVLESAVVKVKDAAPETDDEFTLSFKKVVDKAINTKAAGRLVVFIDELDRCSPKDLVATLIDLKTFLGVEGCVFIVAADREVLERALREVPQANPIRDEDPYYSTPGAFLDKIFQHQIPLPPLRPQALTRFARELVETQSGLWAELRGAEPDDRLFLRVVYTLIPVHVRSPRRVKVLLNNYATNVRIAELRGINWIDRATELAYLTVVQTEFPAVAADLVRIPRLLAYLRGSDCSTASAEVQRVVKGYRLGTEAQNGKVPEDAQAAGPILVDNIADSAAKDRANRVLNAQLRSYLRRVAAQDVPDPRPDLSFLQSAGQKEGLTDPDLGYAIDFAADLAATEVVEAFAKQNSTIIATGVRLLVQQAEAERGPGRTNIIEAACRLIERLDRHDLEAVSPVAAGGVLADVDGPDWRREATPGALLVGVFGARPDLLNRLLKREPAADLAEDGLLTRLSRMLAFANDEQATPVHNMLGATYGDYPQPLHDALGSLPLEAALRLWNGTIKYIDEALTDEAYESQPVAAPTRSTGAAAATADQEDEEEDDDTPSVAERYAALITAVERRSDKSGELVSLVLELGQRSKNQNLRKTVREYEDDALAMITDPNRVSLHALLGIQRAPIGDASFWAEKLTGARAYPELALDGFTRVIEEIDQADPDECAGIAQAASALVVEMTDAQAAEAKKVLATAFDALDWTEIEDDKARDTLFTIANNARPLLDGEDIDRLLAKSIAEGLRTAGTSDTFMCEAVNRTGSLSESSAAYLEAELESADEWPLPTLWLRIAAASRTGTNIVAADILAVKNEEDIDRRTVSKWLALRPPVADVMQVLRSGMKFNREPLGAYAIGLNLEDRTSLWILCEERQYTSATLRVVGASGVASSAIDHIAARVAAETQQAKRDDSVARLLEAQLTEQPPHAAATRLVQQLLATNINGNASLAARVAIASGGAARGNTISIRNAFDTVVGTRPNSIAKSDQQRLREINLLSRSNKVGAKSNSLIRGTIGGIFRGSAR